MSRKTQNYLALVIAVIFISGLFLPYQIEHITNSDTSKDYYVTNHGWELIHFRVIIVFCAIIVGSSFSRRIALRLLLIRITLALFIPLLFTTILIDSSFLYGEPYAAKPGIGCYITYLGICLTIVYGILHFRTSYPKYKQMLKQELDNEADLLDV